MVVFSSYLEAHRVDSRWEYFDRKKCPEMRTRTKDNRCKCCNRRSKNRQHHFRNCDSKWTAADGLSHRTLLEVCRRSTLFATKCRISSLQ